MNYLSLFAFLLLVACSDTNTEATTSVAPEMPVSSYANRVAAAKERLGQTTEGQRIWQALEAHGGLENWYAKSPLHFRFNYQPDEGAGLDTRILNDYVNSRTVHTMVSDSSVRYGWDGNQAWLQPADANPGTSVRFWSLTPYYFVGLPFVLADEGIHFSTLEPLEWQENTYTPIKVTYGNGVGDAPDDYYVIYLNEQTNQLDALRYIVSYRGFFEDGQHLPEKLMTITEHITVDGMILPAGFQTRWWNDGKPSEVNTKVEVTEYAFHPQTSAAAFAMPTGAKVMEDEPK